jgi:four helix bundle protein
MHDTNDELTFPFQRLDVYLIAKEMAVGVHRAGISDAELRDQATRASKSCFLNLSEGLPSDSVAMRRRFFCSAAGSAAEVAAAVDLAAAIDAIDADAAKRIGELAVRIKKMLRRLR